MSFTCFDVDQLSPRTIYSLLIESVVPRPIAFITTLGREGAMNAAPFSFFNAVCSQPPMISVSFTPKRDGSVKDTLRNIRETREFVVNIVPDALVESINQASAEYPYGVSELEEVGLTAVPSARVRPPRVKESPVQFECRLYQEIPVGEGPGSAVLVLGEVLAFQVDDSVLTDSSLKPQIGINRLNPVARLGGIDYAKGFQVFSLPRPQIGKKESV